MMMSRQLSGGPLSSLRRCLLLTPEMPKLYVYLPDALLDHANVVALKDLVA